jgi:Ca2+-binding EF-hand superfamily protein
VLAEGSVNLEQMLQRGRDKENESLQLSSSKGELIANLIVSVRCIDTLRLVQAAGATAAPSASASLPSALPPMPGQTSSSAAGAFSSSADSIAISVGRLAWRGAPPLAVTSIAIDVDVMGLSDSLLSTAPREAGNGVRPVSFEHSAQLPVRMHSRAWQLLAHALRTVEKGDSDVFFSVRDAHPDGGMIAEGFVNLETLLESGKDVVEGTPIELVDISGKVVADLHVGVRALPLMHAVQKQIEQQGGTVAAAAPLPAGSISVSVESLSWSSTFSQEKVRTVALEVDLMGLLEPKTRSESLLRRRKLVFDLTASVELKSGSAEWSRVARALQTVSKSDSEVRFVLLDTSGRSASVLAEGSVNLEQMLQRGRDKENESLQLSSSKGELIANLIVSVRCVDSLRALLAMQAGSVASTQADSQTLARYGAGLSISVSKLSWLTQKPYGVREVIIEVDVMGALESLLSTKPTALHDVDGGANFGYVSHLSVPPQSHAWMLIARALRTPEKGDSDVFFSVRDAHPDGGLVAEGFVNLETLLESGSDLADGTPVDLVSPTGVLIGKLEVGVQAVTLMREILKHAAVDGASGTPTPTASPRALPTVMMRLSAGEFSWAPTARTEQVRSVAIELDVIGLREPKPRSKPLLRRRKLQFELKTKFELAQGSQEWIKVANMLQPGSKAAGTEVRFTLLDVSAANRAVSLASGAIRLDELLERGKDVVDERLRLYDGRQKHVADLVVGVAAFAALKQIQASGPVQSPLALQVKAGHALSLQLHRLVLARAATLGALNQPRSILFEVDLLGAAEQLPTSKQFLWRDEIALDFNAQAACAPGTPGLSAIVSALDRHEQRGLPLNIYVTARDAATLAPIGEASIPLGDLLKDGVNRERETCDMFDMSGKALAELRYSLFAVDALREARAARASTSRGQPELPTSAREQRKAIPSNTLSDEQRIAALGLPAAKLDELRDSFRKYDTNNSGAITKLEMRRALEAAGVKSSSEAVEAAFAKADADGDGRISYAEYCELHALGVAGAARAAPPPAPTRALAEASAQRQTVRFSRAGASDAQRIAALRLPESKLNELRDSFNKYDRDRSGEITRAEMRLALESAGAQVSAATIEATFSKADADGNGTISFAEYCELHSLLGPSAGAGHKDLSESALRRVFDAYDLEREGCLPATMLPHALRGLGVTADAKQSRAALARLGLQPPEATSSGYSFAAFCDVANRLHVQAAVRAQRPLTPTRGGATARLSARPRSGASEIRSLLDQAENEKSALRASLAREQALRRQTAAELSTALERVSLLERLIPASLESAGASGAKLGAGPGSVEARAAALAAELRTKAGPEALAAHAARSASGARGPSPARFRAAPPPVQNTAAADAYRKNAEADRREIHELRVELNLAREAAVEERSARRDAERKIEAVNRRAAHSQVGAD